MTETVEAPRSEKSFTVSSRFVKDAVEAVKQNQGILATEWRLMTSLETQRPLAKYLANAIGSDQDIAPNSPFPITGLRQRDDMLQGALIMYRAIRTKPSLLASSRQELADITPDIVSQHLEQRDATMSGQTQEERSKSFVDMTFAGANRALLEELNQLTGGEINYDVAYGAAELFSLFELAYGAKPQHFNRYFADLQPRTPVSAPEPYRIPAARELKPGEFSMESPPIVSEKVLKHLVDQGIDGTPVHRLKDPGGKEGWIFTKPKYHLEPDVVLKATRIRYGRRGGMFRIGDPVILTRDMDSMFLSVKGGEQGDGIWVQADNHIGSISTISHDSTPSSAPSIGRHARK